MKKETFESIKEKGLLIYEYVRGSQSYGLATEESDVDTGGVFLAPAEQLLGLGFDYQDQIESDSHDDVWFEFNKFMRLLLSSNPTVLESLFIPEDCIIYEHPIMTELKKHRDKFITKKCFKSFGSYAVSQIQKARGLNKMIVNPVVERKGPLDFAYTFYRQGSTGILNWLEHRGLQQKYCGLVNVPNMVATLDVYYDWGNHFLNEENDYLDMVEAWRLSKEGDTVEIIRILKDGDGLDSTQRKVLKLKLKVAQLGNMVRFICSFYGVKVEDGSFLEWFKAQEPIGYRGMVGEDKLSNELRLSSVSKDEKPICHMNYNKDGYSKHCVDYKNFKDWEEHRNPVRYQSNLKKNYDAKNISHSFRLVSMCIEIARGEGFKVDRRGIDREFILDVKNHKYEYEEVMAMLDKKKAEMDETIAASTIPEEIDKDFVNGLLLCVRKKQLGLVNDFHGEDMKPRHMMKVRLDSFLKLETDWDGYGALPIERKSYDNALMAIDLFPAGEIRKWAVFPNTNGTLTFEAKDAAACISVGNVSFSWVVMDGIAMLYSGEDDFNEANFKKVVNKMTEYTVAAKP